MCRFKTASWEIPKSIALSACHSPRMFPLRPGQSPGFLPSILPLSRGVPFSYTCGCGTPFPFVCPCALAFSPHWSFLVFSRALLSAICFFTLLAFFPGTRWHSNYCHVFYMFWWIALWPSPVLVAFPSMLDSYRHTLQIECPGGPLAPQALCLRLNEWPHWLVTVNNPTSCSLSHPSKSLLRPTMLI